uniref:LytTR family transcriptional regulator DNA-binding domain-containing protein n=1 Tax=Gelidibacter sp. TaxID=2018083 RepID=UPI004049C3B5
MNAQAFLNQPFDYLNTSKSKWLYVLNSTFFAIIFLVLFQPYGISEEVSSPMNPVINIVLFFFSIALSTFIALSLSQFWARKSFRFDNVTIKKYIAWFFIEALFLTLCNFIFSFIIPDLGGDFERELNLFFQIKIYLKVVIVLMFPFFGTIIYFLIQNLNYEINELGEQLKIYKQKFNSNQKEEVLRLKDENDNFDFSIALKDLLFAEASNQYIVIHYFKSETIKKHILRNRMKNFLLETENLPIKQCHRSYAVNLLNVNYITRIDGKEFLIMDTMEPMRIPISKAFLSAIKETIPQGV